MQVYTLVWHPVHQRPTAVLVSGCAEGRLYPGVVQAYQYQQPAALLSFGAALVLLPAPVFDAYSFARRTKHEIAVASSFTAKTFARCCHLCALSIFVVSCWLSFWPSLQTLPRYIFNGCFYHGIVIFYSIDHMINSRIERSKQAFYQWHNILLRFILNIE